jgi:hypothetical protein
MESLLDVKNKNRRFYIYRYQLLARIDPEKPQFVYMTPEKNYTNVEDLRKDKNKIFFKMINKIEFKWFRAEISHEIVYTDEETCLIRLAVNRPTVLRTEDFKSVSTNDWPWIYIFIDNNPEKQFLVIEINSDAWDSPDITINMLSRNINEFLNRYYLLAEIEPLIEKNAFWEFVEKHKGQIKIIEFDMVSPNMSNISEKSNWPLREIRDQYNATRQKVRLENSVTSIVVQKDELIESMADYSADGGGKTRFKIKGFRGYKSLSDDKISIEFEDLDIRRYR